MRFSLYSRSPAMSLFHRISQTPLSIGDPVPDIQFENILNYPAKKVKTVRP